jgi:glycosyltransferase involved in cell wall biosynthesis
MIYVSTIIPTYNSAATIARAIDSALAQDSAEHEVIVVDDGSTDSTMEVLRRYVDLISVIEQPNRGPSAARNAGAAIAHGKYLAFLDSDDVWLTEKLVRTVGSLEANPSAVLAYSDFVAVDVPSRKCTIQQWDLPATITEMLSGSPTLLTSTTVMRKEVFEACGGFCEQLRAFEDHLLFLRAREHGDFLHIAEPLVEYHNEPFARRLLRYEAARPTFERLMRARYGRKAIPYIEFIQGVSSNALFQEALRRVDEHEIGEALRFLWAAFSMRPLFLFERKLVTRLASPKNVRRMLGLQKKADRLESSQRPIIPESRPAVGNLESPSCKFCSNFSRHK